jgi:hypothetical protein
LLASVTVPVTVNAPPPLVAPTGLAASVTNRSVRLTWVDNATTEAGYRVERATVNRNGTLGTWGVVATLLPNVTAYTHAGTKGSWAYRVQAYATGQLAPSNVVRVTLR